MFLGKVSKGVNCSVAGCTSPAERSMSRDSVASSGLKVPGDRRAFLCHEHYKEWKKATKISLGNLSGPGRTDLG